MTPTIECRRLTAGYAHVPVVRDLDMHVDAGEVVVLLGPNGAGKTTTLLTIAGVLDVIDGDIELSGHSTVGKAPHQIARRGLSLVPDHRSIFFNLTTRENMRLARGAETSPVDLILDYFPALRSRLDVRAGLLSGGEQQMLAIGRALAMAPKALMVDEMTLGLAPLIVQQIFPTIRRIATDLDVAVLLVEQHVEMALKFADRAYVLAHGEVVQQGTAKEMLADRHLLEASYLGAVST